MDNRAFAGISFPFNRRGVPAGPGGPAVHHLGDEILIAGRSAGLNPTEVLDDGNERDDRQDAPAFQVWREHDRPFFGHAPDAGSS